MKIKTSELTGAALDWAVARIEYPNDTAVREARTPGLAGLVVAAYAFSTDWSQSGPIIERERLILRPYFTGAWECAASPSVWQAGPTPMIAAMRCYVTSKLGEEVDVPEELT